MLVPLGGPHRGAWWPRGACVVRRARSATPCARRRRANAKSRAGARRELAVSGVDIAWSELGESASGDAARLGSLARAHRGRRSRALRPCEPRRRGVRVELRGAEATLGANQKLHGARLAELESRRRARARLARAPSRRAAAGAVIRASAAPASRGGRPGWRASSTAGRALLRSNARRRREARGRERCGRGSASETSSSGSVRAASPSARTRARSRWPCFRRNDRSRGSTPLSMGLRLPLAEGEPKLEIEGGPVGFGSARRARG